MKEYNFIPEFITNNLKKKKEHFINGYLLLIDMKDSTSRKKKYERDWMHQTEAFYQIFNEFVTKIDKDHKDLELIATKFLGDGGMSFFKLSESTHEDANHMADSKISCELLNKIYSLMRELEDQQDALGAISIRPVITYLSGVYLFDVEVSGHKMMEIIGEGVDFSFRIEKYADTSHVVINKYFFTSIKDIVEKKQDYIVQKCERTIKGWDRPQDFYIITKPGMIENSIEKHHSSTSDGNVLLEIFKGYLDNRDEASLQQDSKPFVEDYSTEVES